MPASAVKKIKLPLATKLYLAARKKASGSSFNAYMISLICRDCGVPIESLDYETRPRATWRDPPEGDGLHDTLLVLPTALAEAMDAKLEAMPYPVPVRGYLRTLIERDLVVREESSHIDYPDRVVDVQESSRDGPPPLSIEEEELFCERHQEHFPIFAKSRVHFWQTQAEQGSPSGQRLYGRCLMEGIGIVQNTAEAMQWILKAAEQGHAQAQLDLGKLYESGKVVESDDTEAIRWYSMAAELDVAEAQYLLGCAYENGCGIEEDTSEAIRWYVASAKQGHAASKEALFNLFMFLLERGKPGDDVEGFHCLRKAAELGFVEAQVALGYRYAHGHGLPQDEDEAVRWNRMAAEQGSAEAQYELGGAYENGWGVEQDITEAIRWYGMAAKKGHTASKKEFERLAGELCEWTRNWKPA